VVSSLRIRLGQDHWYGRFSRTHPTLRIEAWHQTQIDSRTSVIDFWISGLPAGEWTREIASHPDVAKVESIAEVGGGGLYRVVQRINPVVKLYRRLGLPLRFPLAILDGVITWEVVAKKADFDRILDFLRRRGLDVVVSSIHRGYFPSDLPVLTHSQRQLLTQAMSWGYFTVPRKLTLTELAARLGRSKSSVSESLAHIERKLLESSMRPVQLAPDGL
jgi:predicted DNA binding protein